MSIVSNVGREVVAGVARSTRAATAADVERAIVRDASEEAPWLLVDSVKSVVRLARSASRYQNPLATEAAFASAGRAAQGLYASGTPELSQALRVAEIAHRTPFSGNSAAQVLLAAKDRFPDYLSRLRLADKAHELGLKDVHLNLLGYLTEWAPSVQEHVRLAGVVDGFAAKDAAYGPLVTRSLSRANDRTVNWAQARFVKAASQELAQQGPASEAHAVARRLYALGKTDAGPYRPLVQQILAEVRDPGYKPFLAALKDYARTAARFAGKIVGVRLCETQIGTRD